MTDAGIELDIEDFATRTTAKQVEYNPEIFSGLIFRDTESRTIPLIFHTGKIVIIGAKSVSDIRELLKRIEKIPHLM